MAAKTRTVGTPRGGTDDDWSSASRPPHIADATWQEMKALADLAAAHDARHFWVLCRFVVLRSSPVQILMSNWPEPWRSRYWAQQRHRDDPALARMAERHAPFHWSELEPLSVDERRYRIEAMQHGIVDGISGMMRFGAAEAALFTISDDAPLDPQRRETLMSAMLLFCARCYPTLRQRALELTSCEPAMLTPRQRDVLRGIMIGQSRVQIADTLGISVSGVENHLVAARRRLGERSNPAAVRKAIAMNLLPLYRHTGTGGGTG